MDLFHSDAHSLSLSLSHTHTRTHTYKTKPLLNSHTYSLSLTHTISQSHTFCLAHTLYISFSSLSYSLYLTHTHNLSLSQTHTHTHTLNSLCPMSTFGLNYNRSKSGWFRTELIHEHAFYVESSSITKKVWTDIVKTIWSFRQKSTLIFHLHFFLFSNEKVLDKS